MTTVSKQDSSAPDASIKILKISGNYAPTIGYTQEGVSFENVANKTATEVLFVFLYIDGSGFAIGQQEALARGNYAPGVPIPRTPRNGFYGAPFTIDHAGLYTSFCGGQTLSEILVSVARVQYADGSTWLAPIPASANVPTARIVDASGDTNVEIVEIYGDDEPRPRQCFDHIYQLVSFVNKSSKAILSVSFTYTYYDSAGLVVASRKKIIKGSFPPGEKMVRNPGSVLAVPGTILPNGAYMVGYGAAARYIAKIVVTATDVSYADTT